jgi:hypothetical protein
MAKVATLQSNFTGGELSPRIDGRVDIKKYANGLRTCENFQVLPHGGVRKRSGTKFVVEQRSADEDVVLVPFQYNVEQSYMLLFGPNYVWFFKDQGIITMPAVTITGISRSGTANVTAPGHGLVAGDYCVIQTVTGMTEVNNRLFEVQSVAGNVVVLDGVDSTSYTEYSSGGTIAKVVQLTTTYAADELEELRFAQSADTLYIAHKNHPLRKLTRSSHTSWTLSTPTITTGPFRGINPTRTLKITPSSFSASATGYGTHIVGTTCTLTATSALFESGHVGALFRLNEEGGATGIESAPVGDTTRSISTNDVYTNEGFVYGVFAVSGASNWGSFTRVPAHDAGTVRVRGSGAHYFDADFLHPGYCVVRITAVASATSATAEIVRYQMPKSVVDSGTSFWEEGAWSDYRGYPRAISFYEQRLFLAGSEGDPNVVWGSRSAAYEDFEDGPDDDDALVYRITSGVADTIRWLSSGRVLTAGSSSGEYAISASSQNEALTPDNFKAIPQTSFGTSAAPPLRLNQNVLYPQRNGAPTNPARKLREFAYSFEQDAYESTDISVFSEHIFGEGFDRIAYQLEPDSIIHCRRTDGQIASCTYERIQEVIAWQRYVLGGDDAQVQAIGTIPGANGDELWNSVSRRIGVLTYLVDEANTSTELITEDGNELITADTETVRYIEVMQAAFEDTDDAADAFFVDSGATYNGSATTTITGLWHLRNQSVKINAGGAVYSGTVSATGSLTLSRSATKAQIGLGYDAKLETEDFEAGAQAGTAQGRHKRITDVRVRLLNSSRHFFIGPDASTLQETYARTGADTHGPLDLYSGLMEKEAFVGGWEEYARVRIEHRDPLPFHVTGIVVDMTTQG